MRIHIHLRRALVVGAAILVALPAVADEPAELTVHKLRVRAKNKGAHCKLRLRLPVDPVLDTVDPSRDALAIRINDRTLLSVPAAAERVNSGLKVKEKKALLWRVRAGRRGPRLKLDLALRNVKLVVRRADLGDALDAPEQGVKVSLDLGERTFETVVDVERRGRVLRLRAPEPPSGTPPGDPGGGGGGGSSAVTPRTVESTWTSGIVNAETTVARTPAEWAALWARHKSTIAPQPALPQVDFSQEMVVAVFLGNRPDPSHSVEIARVTSDGTTTAVEYRDVRLVPSQSGSCFFPAVVAQPSVLVRVPKTTRATFSGQIVQRPCP